jgi:RNA polymerase sigma-70 factor, ECF subfamily
LQFRPPLRIAAEAVIQHDADRARIKSLLAGDDSAFNAFFNEFFPRVYRFVLPRVELHEESAQDVCQETMSRAMRRLHTYRGEAALFTWLCQIARNAIADHWQKQGRHQAHLVFVEDDPSVRAVLDSLESPAVDSPEAQRYGEEIGRAVQVVLDHLPGRYSDALEWKYVEGLSIAEIAERLGSSIVGAQSILQRARSAFQEAFGAMPLDPDLRFKP